jgi:hypothetical protein
MHFRLPKPLHGWREFVGEVGIIVLGVLIALSAEQFIEMLHWRSEVREERRALLGEVRYNLGAALYRVSEQQCIDRKLAQISTVFERHASGQPLGLRSAVGRPVAWFGTTGTWEIATSGQALVHMPIAEKLRFSDAFGTYNSFILERNEEDKIWRGLDLLDEAKVLNENDWSKLHEAYANAKSMDQRMRLITFYLIKHASVGERPEMPDVGEPSRVGERTFCASLIE